MFITSWRKSFNLSGLFLPFSLLIAVTLVFPGLLNENSGAALFSPQQPEKNGLTPQTGQWAYITTAVQRFIIINKWALLPLVTNLVVLSVNIAGRLISALSQAALPQTHRLQFLIPIYYSTYT